MLCDICGYNTATVHLTEIVNDQMTELHLCEDCAREKGAQMEQHFGLADLLAGLADFGKQIGAGNEIKSKCPNCGLSYEDFKKIGRLGCGECYTAFKKNLMPLLKRIHGSDRHSGRVPVGAGAKQTKEDAELRTQKEKLKQAIQLEEFEEAAKIRDEIKRLEKKG